MIDDQFDETEDLPPPPLKQELENPDLVVDLPPIDPSAIDDGGFDVGESHRRSRWRTGKRHWTESDTIQQWSKSRRPASRGVVGQELGGQGWKTIHSAPDESGPTGAVVQVSDEAVREAVQWGLLDMAELLTVEAGYAATFRDQVYSALLHHVRAKSP